MKRAFLWLMLGVLWTTSCEQGTSEKSPAAEKPIDPNAYVLSPIPGTDAQQAIRKTVNDVIIEKGLIKNGKKVGAWVTYHDDERHYPKSIASMVDGKYNGIYMEFNNRGYLSLKAEYTNNRLDGEWGKYQFGRPTHEATYKNGELDGIYREYHPTRGHLLKEMTYVEGVLDGPYRYYDKEGNLTMEYLYRNGEKISGGMVESEGQEE